MTDISANPAQAPRRRIIDAALELAYEGGFDGLQVRALADRAGVSSRTIYTNFPSLESLLILAVAERSQELYRHYTERPPRGRSAAARVQRLIADLTEVMTANRPLTQALLRALLCGKPDVVPYVRGFGEVLRSMLSSAIAPDGPTAADREAAEILEAIWFTALIGWATGADDDAHISELMRSSARRLLKGR
jgi:AcrR family transcriptional regulator